MLSAATLSLASDLVPGGYLELGSVEVAKRAGLARVLLSQRCLPVEGWPDAAIVAFLGELSAMDSNNYTGAVGAGEREARVFSRLVAARHWGLGHGVGRSGDVAAVQPKAAGSSLLYALTNRLALHAVRVCGVVRTEAALVLPLATGMALTMCLLTMRAARPRATRVVWSRIDQKSALKCIVTAGLAPVVVEPLIDGDELRTDVAGVRAAILAGRGAGDVVCVLSTTSCFAPRGPDSLLEVGALCAEFDVPHLVNHAYGLQAGPLSHLLNEACRGWPPPRPRRGGAGGTPSREGRPAGASGGAVGDVAAAEGVGGAGAAVEDATPLEGGLDAGGAGGGCGAASADVLAAAAAAAPVPAVSSMAAGGPPARAPPPRCRVDAWVSSTDKNFMVPVGGSIVGSPDEAFIDALARTYPGRASLSPIVDLFVTLLAMGSVGLRRLLAQRRAVFPLLRDALARVAAAHGERVLHSPRNPVSLAMTLSRITSAAGDGAGSSSRDATYLGSMLFSRGVSGTRVVARGDAVRVTPECVFPDFGASHAAYPHCPYVTAAAGLGMTPEDVSTFEDVLARTVAEFKRQRHGGAAAAAAAR